MEGPPANPRICAIAKRISPLPPEIIAPIIADQQLHRVLELSLVPTAGPKLLWAIKNSLQWKWLFVRDDGVNQFEAFQRLFRSINLMSWIWCRQVAMQVPRMAKRYHLNVDSQSKETSLEQLQKDFLVVFRNFLWVAEWNTPLNGLGQAELKSIARFLPKDILTLVESTVTSDSIQALSLEECMQSPESTAELASAIVHHEWTAEKAQNVLPYLAQAIKLQAAAKSQELLRLADLYEVFPAELKEPFDPQDRRETATKHIVDSLRRDAQRMVTRPLRTSGRVQRVGWPTIRSRPSYRFRYPHPALVPANWVLRLMCLALERYPLPADGDAAGAEDKAQGLKYPPELVADLRQCIEGLPNILEYGGVSSYARYKHLGGPSSNVAHVSYLKKTEEAMPHSYKELDWLEALLRCVSWIKGEAPELVQECLTTPADKYSGGAKALGTGKDKDKKSPGLESLLKYEQLLTQEDYDNYIEAESAEVLAQQLRLDASLGSGDLEHLPSLLALYLPPIPTERARDIAYCLLPEADRTVREVMYQDMVKKARTAIRRAPHMPPSQETMGYTYGEGIKDSTANLSAEGTWGGLARLRRFPPGTNRWALKILLRLPNRPPAKTQVSLPPNLQLEGRVALVTGGRINLGFHTALRLLRCGAAVIVSTRYPEDAVTRYESESDSSVWGDRLKIIGADFRAAGDAFQLAEQVRKLVGQMGGMLHILVNNAAQTLTDSVKKEQSAISREKLLKGLENEKPMLITHSYEPRVRGVTDYRLIESASTETAKIGSIETENVVEEKNQNILASQETANTTLAVSEGEDGPSSWAQSLADIPYEDVISAHSVNTFVPLILIRELMPLMCPTTPSEGAAYSSAWHMRRAYPGSPVAYVVNVSSREGIFEKSVKSASKNGKHVHTNMSKAGLNMLTETEAYRAWCDRRVAMNTVDPGYMSAAPECEQALGGERPLGWEDGAGRVLWPVAMGETSKKTHNTADVIWGRFLKHYGATRVDVRLGRG
ncbi:hypothetical protein PG990_007360 [Apiospora arundinis]